MNFSYSYGVRLDGTVNQLSWYWVPYATIEYLTQPGLAETAALGSSATYNAVADSTAAVTNPTAMGNKYNRFKFKDLSRKFTIQNCGNVDMHLMLYECVARRDMEDSYYDETLGAIGTALDDDDVIDRTKSPYSNTTIASYKNPSFTLYMSHRFCQDWRIKKAIPVTLPAAKYFTYVMKQKAYSSTWMKLAEQYASNIHYIGKYTKCLVIAHKGQLGDDSAVPGQVGFFDLTYNLFYEDKLKYTVENADTEMVQYRLLGDNDVGTDCYGNTTRFSKNETDVVLVARAAEVIQVPASAAPEGPVAPP